MNKIRILQLGEIDWNRIYVIPKTVILDYVHIIVEVPEKPYDIIFLDRTPSEEEIELLYQSVKAYTMFVTKRVDVSGKMAWLCKSKKARHIAEREIQSFLKRETKYYYPKPYGEKFRFNNLTISRDFPGTIKWNGNYDVVLVGDYGEEYSQIVYWRNNTVIRKGQVIDLWLEYRKDPDVSIALSVTKFAADGSIGAVLGQWEFCEEELEQVIPFENEGMDGYLFFSISAKGSGQLRIIALHNRFSRGTHGYFLPGGERYVTSEREEVFCYFDPRDMKPPLNIFFAGWEITENFQGYNLNRKLGCPFLLLAEHRLMGGGFYVGTEEYEELIAAIIKKYMKELGFSPDQVIMSGLSMGAYASMYYGADVKPHALILMKPLAGIGNVAANEKYSRPGGFPTSLDVLKFLGGDTDAKSVRKLNDKFWKKFDAADWGKTKFVVSYMIEDDFENDVYEAMISRIHSEGVQVYGKGLHGRHGDSQAVTANWFSRQFNKIIRDDFFERNDYTC